VTTVQLLAADLALVVIAAGSPLAPHELIYGFNDLASPALPFSKRCDLPPPRLSPHNSIRLENALYTHGVKAVAFAELAKGCPIVVFSNDRVDL